MDEKYSVAVASTGGTYVDEHFGRASRFLVFDITEDENIVLKEERNFTPACSCMRGFHDDDALYDNASAFGDCRCLIASRIGPGALRILSEYGIEGYELPGKIEEAVHRMVQYRKVQALFS